MSLEPVYGPLCSGWEPDMPLDIQDGCEHGSCWFTGTWGRYSGAPRPAAGLEPVIKQAVPREQYL
jgi:hypothetical protein